MDSVARIISAYDSQGVHRTGTPADEASAYWLADEIGRIGLAPTLMPFRLNRLDVATATLTVNGEVFEGLPRFDGPGTEASGISGRLGLIGGDAEIGLLAAKAHSDERIETARNETNHKAIIHITEGAPPGLTPVNADAFSRPFGLPMLQVSNAHRDRLEAAAENNAEATVTIDVSRNPAQAFNVEASLDGRQPYLDPLVVMTPRSGWWQCASERGGGLVVFLEIMRTLSEAGTDRPVIFTANSGHELGHIGLDHFIDMHPDLVKSAAYWIHLGANFAAASGSNVCLQASDDALLNLGRSAMKEAGSVPDVETPLGQRPRGEARNIFDGGGSYISLLGTNGLFHHPHDRWPEAIDQEKTKRLARAFCGVAMALSED